MMKTDWPFEDPPNVAVLTTQLILDGSDWIQSVYHDFEDGMWQFHPADGELSSARVVSLALIIKMDPSIYVLADLPIGWRAWRHSRSASWVRRPVDH